MKLENQVCSLELAKKLKELGVVEVSIFFYEWSGAKDLSMNENNKSYFNIDGINAYSVAELGEMIKHHIHYQDYKESGEIWLFDDSDDIFIEADTEANARAKMRINLIEKGLVKI